MAKVSLNSNEQQLAATVVTWFQENCGMTLAGACGIAGNIRCESDFNYKAFNPNDCGGPSGGLCQWHNSRFYNLQNFASSHGGAWNGQNGMALQLEFLKSELTKSFKGLYSFLQSATSPTEASNRWGHDFEKFAGFKNYSTPEYGKRASYAQLIFNGMNSKNSSWEPTEITNVEVASDYAQTNNTTYTIEAGSNKVYMLSSVKRQNENVLKQSDDRKAEFQALQSTMVNNTPELGRTIILSEEMYDSNILKGGQESKKERI